MGEHELKCWLSEFEGLLTGHKRHEFRRNDRDFMPGDVLRLREWRHLAEQYTGRELRMRVTWVGRGFGIPDGYVCMSVAAEGQSGAGRGKCAHDKVHTALAAKDAWLCDVCGAKYGVLPRCESRSGQSTCGLVAGHPGAHLALAGKTGRYQDTWWAPSPPPAAESKCDLPKLTPEQQADECYCGHPRRSHGSGESKFFGGCHLIPCGCEGFLSHRTGRRPTRG